MSVGTWTADDAVRVAAGFTRWLGTSDAHRLHRSCFTTSALSDDQRDEAASAATSVLAYALSTEPVIWCDPAMVDMLAASSGIMPVAAMSDPVLLPPSGMAVFAKDLPVEWGLKREDDGRRASFSERLRAVSWSAFTEGVAAMLICLWVAGDPVTTWFPDGRKGRTCRLHPANAYQIFTHDQDLERDEAVNAGPMRLLRTLGELSRHRITREDDAPSSKASRRAARAAGVNAAGIRRLYLQRPEDAGHELNALRAERSGSVSAHWVRAHWKRQWHPSIQEHRWTYIEGYPRGEGTLSAPTQPTALIARGSIAS